MESYDLDRMKESIEWAKNCKPARPDIPKVGAIIVVNGSVIGRGRRGTGIPGDDHHAEWNALREVADRSQLPRATVYTTLEPCTPGVRSDPLNCCTELIRQAGVKRVYIGILDPNQDVRGKGLWELQERGVEVELFPPDLANEIRALNSDFIRTQRTLGIRITEPANNKTLVHSDLKEPVIIKGTFLNAPGKDVFAFVRSSNGYCAPHPLLEPTDDGKWEAKVYFAAHGLYTIAIVKANELAVSMINYYWKIAHTNIERRNKILNHVASSSDNQETKITDFIRSLKDDYQGIAMATFPKGLEVQASVEINLIDISASNTSTEVITHLPDLDEGKLLYLHGYGRYLIESVEASMAGRRLVKVLGEDGLHYYVRFSLPELLPLDAIDPPPEGDMSQLSELS
jgi:pyrimidine deaminase RibD-like protein